MQDDVKPGTFLQKRSYRRRRLRDGLRFLPLIGAWLFLMPVLWPHAGDGVDAGRLTSKALIYVFGVWAVLVMLSAGFMFLYNGLRDVSDEANGAEEG